MYFTGVLFFSLSSVLQCRNVMENMESLSWRWVASTAQFCCSGTLSLKGTCLIPTHRRKESWRSTEDRITFSWPCCSIKRWIYIQPLLTPSGLSFPSLAGTGTHANFCIDKDLSWHPWWCFSNKFDTRHQKYLPWGETALYSANVDRSLLKLCELNLLPLLSQQ